MDRYRFQGEQCCVLLQVRGAPEEAKEGSAVVSGVRSPSAELVRLCLCTASDGGAVMCRWRLTAEHPHVRDVVKSLQTEVLVVSFGAGIR